MAGTVLDHVGRTSDLLAFQAIGPVYRGRPQLLAQELVRANDGGSLVTGIQKLAQRVLLVLLTPLGSRQYRPREGTLFMTDAQMGLWRTVADVQQSFSSARLDVARQLRAIESDSDPDDERYGNLTLTGVTLAGDKVSIRLLVESKAGTSYSLITPIQVPVR
jgi:hypothetical protein